MHTSTTDTTVQISPWLIRPFHPLDPLHDSLMFLLGYSGGVQPIADKSVFQKLSDRGLTARWVTGIVAIEKQMRTAFSSGERYGAPLLRCANFLELACRRRIHSKNRCFEAHQGTYQGRTAWSLKAINAEVGLLQFQVQEEQFAKIAEALAAIIRNELDTESQRCLAFDEFMNAQLNALEVLARPVIAC